MKEEIKHYLSLWIHFLFGLYCYFWDLLFISSHMPFV